MRPKFKLPNFKLTDILLKFWVYLGVRTCELFLCFVAIVRVRVIMLTSLFSLCYVTREFHRFLHRGRAEILVAAQPPKSNTFTVNLSVIKKQTICLMFPCHLTADSQN